MAERSKLVSLRVRNLGCIGPEGLEIALDNIVCLVGRNNAGKSTILKAYELAQGSQALSPNDRCQWTPEDDFPEVELSVHIPDGITNIDAKWKDSSLQGYEGYKIVRSRWQWKNGLDKPVRQTWDKEADGGIGNWAEDGKAAGADNVFNSRLPQPIRIDSLQDALKEHEELLKLVTEPVAQELKQLQADPESELRRAINEVVAKAMLPVKNYQEDIDKIAAQVGDGFKGVFPHLDIAIRVEMDPPTIDAAKSLLSASTVKIKEGAHETNIKQQGTGSRRALFWSLLQVRNLITRERKARAEVEKEKTAVAKKLDAERVKAKPKADTITELEARLAALESGLEGNEVALPGHILLIDEPENALHPMATRAARDYLYALANDPNWQVILTTHSPYFVDPLEDHTTIVRLEREGNVTTPRTFRTSKAKFSDDDRENLRALLQLDTALSEMFFGSYPIIVEGDTENAAFIASILEEESPLGESITLVPARGKAIIEPLIRLLTHFKIPFGVLHDADSPKRSDGKGNGAWTVNKNIISAIEDARHTGIVVRHRVSIPDFERRLGGLEESKDKPILAYRFLKKEAAKRAEIQALFKELYDSNQHTVVGHDEMNDAAADSMAAIEKLVAAWADVNAVGDVRFQFPEKGKAVQGD